MSRDTESHTVLQDLVNICNANQQLVYTIFNIYPNALQCYIMYQHGRRHDTTVDRHFAVEITEELYSVPSPTFLKAFMA